MASLKKALVIEPDDAYGAVLEWTLEAVPCKVWRVKDGQAALDLIEKEEFDAIVLNPRLPELSSKALLRVLSVQKIKKLLVVINPAADSMWRLDQKKDYDNQLRVEIFSRPDDLPAMVEAMQSFLGLSATVVTSEASPKKNVLIVDDESEVREMYVPFFASKGYEAKAAKNGREAIEVLQKSAVDLMILDLSMPEMTGEEVMRAMVDHPAWKKIPIIIDTALASSSDRVKTIEKNFAGQLNFDFFQRPTSLEELSQAILRILIP